jgi:UDP-N-acetylmuramyl-tripeptide synthetase
MKLSTLLNGVKTFNTFKDVEIEGITDKDNEINKNTLFVCINGDTFDGHLIAKTKIINSVAVLTEKDLHIENQIIVENTRKAYSIIASNFYNNAYRQLKLIGITGTNGKTSTAHFIKNILDDMGVKCGLIGTVGNVLGCDETAANLTTPEPMELHYLFSQMVKNGCEYCVMEASSQALSQYRVYGLEFQMAILTNITQDHLDYHKSMDNYIKSKLMLFDMSKQAIVNIDDENVRNNLNEISCNYFTTSTVSNSADFTAKNIVCNESGIRYEFVGIDCIGRVKASCLGRFNVTNTLLAIGALIKLGFDFDRVIDSAQKVKNVKGRAEKVDINADFTVLIDYAHTPDGLENILKSVSEISSGRVITVFGCGGNRDSSKRAIMGKIAEENSDVVIVTSDNPRNENPLLIINDILSGFNKSKSKLAVIENRKQAIHYALKKARKNDVVLIAGKGHEKYQIIGNEKIPFDERKIVKDFINGRE